MGRGAEEEFEKCPLETVETEKRRFKNSDSRVFLAHSGRSSESRGQTYTNEETDESLDFIPPLNFYYQNLAFRTFESLVPIFTVAFPQLLT